MSSKLPKFSSRLVWMLVRLAFPFPLVRLVCGVLSEVMPRGKPPDNRVDVVELDERDREDLGYGDIQNAARLSVDGVRDFLRGKAD